MRITLLFLLGLAACGGRLDETANDAGPDVRTTHEAGRPADASADASTVDAHLDPCAPDELPPLWIKAQVLDGPPKMPGITDAPTSGVYDLYADEWFGPGGDGSSEAASVVIQGESWKFTRNWENEIFQRTVATLRIADPQLYYFTKVCGDAPPQGMVSFSVHGDTFDLRETRNDESVHVMRYVRRVPK